MATEEIASVLTASRPPDTPEHAWVSLRLSAALAVLNQCGVPPEALAAVDEALAFIRAQNRPLSDEELDRWLAERGLPTTLFDEWPPLMSKPALSATSPASCDDRNQRAADSLAWATALIARAEQEGRYGVVSFHFDGGRITHAREEATYKPPAPGRRVRDTDGRG